jgi:HlyD family secretion protein
MAIRRWILTPLLLAALAAGSWLVYQWLTPKPLPKGLIYANGQIEGTEIRISAEVAGRIVKAPLREGSKVQAGDLLAQVDPSTYTAQLAEARAQRTATGEGLVALKAQLKMARHHLQTAQTNLERWQKLRAQGAGTKEDLEAAENRQREAQSQVDVLEAQAAQAQSRLQAADEQIELLRLQLEKTEIRAPLDATVLVKGVEEGELATLGRLIAVLVDLSRLELRVYIPERELGQIKLGDPARVRVDAFPGRLFDARVQRIDQQAQFTPRDVHMPEERVRVVFGITLALANKEGFLHPGMPADAWIKWNPETPWPSRFIVPE